MFKLQKNAQGKLKFVLLFAGFSVS